MKKGNKKDQPQEKKDSGSGNYENDIPIDGNVVNYHTNKTAEEEGKEVALDKDAGDRKREEE